MIESQGLNWDLIRITIGGRVFRVASPVPQESMPPALRSALVVNRLALTSGRCEECGGGWRVAESGGLEVDHSAACSAHRLRRSAMVTAWMRVAFTPDEITRIGRGMVGRIATR